MLIDSHFHLLHEKYRENGKLSQDIINEAKGAGVEKLIAVGISLEDGANVLEEAKKFDNVFVAIGVYPHEDLDKSLSEIYEGLDQQYLVNKAKIVAIGECGIDLTDWQGGRRLEDQIELFKLQIGFAATHDLPLVLHNRNGDDQMLSVINTYHADGVKITGVLHCFVSNWEFAKQMLDLGFYISFSGLITYPSRKNILETVKNVPEDRFLIETDAPYLPPQGRRGEVNYPKYVKIVAEKVAEVKKVSFEQIAQLSYKNTCKLFSL